MKTVPFSQPNEGDRNVLILVSVRFAGISRTLVKQDLGLKIFFDLDDYAIYTAPAWNESPSIRIYIATLSEHRAEFYKWIVF